MPNKVLNEDHRHHSFLDDLGRRKRASFRKEGATATVYGVPRAFLPCLLYHTVQGLSTGKPQKTTKGSDRSLFFFARAHPSAYQPPLTRFNAPLARENTPTRRFVGGGGQEYFSRARDLPRSRSISGVQRATYILPPQDRHTIPPSCTVPMSCTAAELHHGRAAEPKHQTSVVLPRVHVHARPRTFDTHAHVCRAKHKQTALDCLSTAADLLPHARLHRTDVVPNRSPGVRDLLHARAYAHDTHTRAHVTRADSARYARARAKRPFLTPKANQNQSGKIL